MSVLVDTSAIYTYFDGDDERHEEVRATWYALLDEQTPLVTTNYVLTETISLLQRRFGFSPVEELLNLMLPELEVVWISPELHQRALDAVLAQRRRHVSFVDCTCFEAMRDQGIEHVFALDAHFAEAGFEVLPGALPADEPDASG
jgi:predicted nucleic acid-binding protein